MNTYQIIGFHVAHSGRIAAHRIVHGRREGWQSEKSWPTLDEAIAGVRVPSGAQLLPSVMTIEESDALARSLPVDPLTVSGHIQFDAGGGEGGIQVRWSDGQTLAIEFTMPGARERFADVLANALIEFRRHRPAARAELHARIADDRWTDPIINYPEERWIKMPGMQNQYVGGHDASQGWLITGRYCHVINVPGYDPDAEGTGPVVRGTDDVLIVGPGAWHGERLYVACLAAVRTDGLFTGLINDITDVLRDAH